MTNRLVNFANVQDLGISFSFCYCEFLWNFAKGFPCKNQIQFLLARASWLWRVGGPAGVLCPWAHCSTVVREQGCQESSVKESPDVPCRVSKRRLVCHVLFFFIYCISFPWNAFSASCFWASYFNIFFKQRNKSMYLLFKKQKQNKTTPTFWLKNLLDTFCPKGN